MIEQLESVRNIFIDVPKQYSFLKEAYEKVNQETQDLLHVLELGTLNAVDMMKVANKLKIVRQERRKIKNELEILDKVKEFAKKKPTEHEINTIIGTVRKLEETQSCRYYRMKVLPELQKFIK